MAARARHSDVDPEQTTTSSNWESILRELDDGLNDSTPIILLYSGQLLGPGHAQAIGKDAISETNKTSCLWQFFLISFTLGRRAGWGWLGLLSGWCYRTGKRIDKLSRPKRTHVIYFIYCLSCRITDMPSRSICTTLPAFLSSSSVRKSVLCPSDR